MRGLGFIKRAVVIATLCAFGLPQAEAIEIFGGSNPVAHMNDDLLTQVRGGGHRHGGGGMHRGGMHRPAERTRGGGTFTGATSTGTSIVI